MSAKNNGGAAFPMYGVSSVVQHGISTRDYFAAKIIASMIRAANGVTFGISHEDTNFRYAKAAYAVADAMLSVREKE